MAPPLNYGIVFVIGLRAYIGTKISN